MSQLPATIDHTGDVDALPTGGQIMSFHFGDPEPVLDRRVLLDMLECPRAALWYEPPITLEGLARAFRIGAHHSSAILLKRNLLAASFRPSRYLDRATFKKIVLDYLVLGNGYIRRIDNRFGDLLGLVHELGKYVRRGVVPGTFFWVPGSMPQAAYDPGSVFQLAQPDVNQEIYGVPEYISALQSALLNEAATLFRRKYYLNGSHTGYILYATGDINEKDLESLKGALKASKGPGNFRNLMIHAPQGKEGSIKIVPISEVGAKDEFLNIKNVTRDDVLASHRVPPQLLGIPPVQGAGFGDVGKATDAFHRLEILPLQTVFLEINDWLGVEAVAFDDYQPMATAPLEAK